MSMDRQDNLLSMDLVRFISILNEYQKTRKVPLTLLNHPKYVDQSMIEQLKNSEPNRITLIDQMIDEYYMTVSHKDQSLFQVVKITFAEYHAKLKTTKLKIVPVNVLSQFREGVNPIAVIHIEGRVLLKMLENDKMDTKRFSWLIDLVSDKNKIVDLVRHIKDDIRTMTDFLVWFHGGPAKDFDYQPSQVYYAERLVEDLKIYKATIETLAKS